MLRPLWALLFIANIAGTLAFRSSLPETVASHFDLAGRPNGWFPRDLFVIFQLSLLLSTNALVFAIYRGIEGAKPGSWMEKRTNIPWKSYWFAPERTAQGLEKLRRILAVAGVYLNFVFVFVLGVIFQENVLRPRGVIYLPVNGGVALVLILAVLMIAWIYWDTWPKRNRS